jgi:hypothetical protein
LHTSTTPAWASSCSWPRSTCPWWVWFRVVTTVGVALERTCVYRLVCGC